MIDIVKKLLKIKSPSLEFVDTFGQAALDEMKDYMSYMADVITLIDNSEDNKAGDT